MIENIQTAGSFWNSWSLPANDRLKWIYRVILIGLVTQMLLSLPLWWATDGVLSYLPVISFLGQWIVKSSMILFPVFILLVLSSLVFLEKTIFPKLLLLTGLVLVLGNIHRLQVWFYFYGLLLFLYLWKKKVPAETLLWTMRGVVVGVYCWSGLHKFNIHFVEYIFPWLIEPFGLTSYTWLAYGAGGVEVLIGLGLLFPSTRNLFVVGSLLFHGIILGVLGPLGHNWNMVVWPWNGVMPLLVFFLFFNIKNIKFNNSGSFFPVFPTGYLVLSLVWILPAFNYLGFTPEQLSFKMYAGSHPEIMLYFSEKDRILVRGYPTTFSLLPPDTTARHCVGLDNMALAEWGTPLFTTPTTARIIGQQFCQQMQHRKEAGILYLVNDEFIRIPCEEKKED